MILTNPIALWALAGLAVPVLIHLLSHDRGRLLPFASVRFIPGLKSQRLRSPSLSLWLLFLVRCLLLGALAMLMARPLLRTEAKLGGPVAVLVSALALAADGEKTLALANEIAAQNGTRPRILAPGFPALRDTLGIYPGGAWSLLAELEDRIHSDTTILVLTADDPRETTARKPLFEHSVEWLVITDAAPAPPVEPLRIGLSASAERQADLNYLRAGLDALQASGLALTHNSLEIVPKAPEYDVFIVLSEEPCSEPARGQLLICDGGPFSLVAGRGEQMILEYAGQSFDLQLSQSKGSGGETLLASRSHQAIASLSRSGAGSLLDWNTRFNPDYAAVVDSWHFPNLLRDLIWNNRLLASGDELQQKTRPGPGLEQWLPGLLVVLLWVLERWLSNRGGNDERPI